MNKLFVKWICVVSVPHYLGFHPSRTFTESHTSKEATLTGHGEANRHPQRHRCERFGTSVLMKIMMKQEKAFR